MLNIIRDVLQGLVCIAEIAGIIAGVVALTRGKRQVGILAVAGFLLLGLNLAVNIGLELFRPYAVSHFIDIAWVSPCVAAPLAFLGIVCLVVAFFSGLPAKNREPGEIPQNKTE